MNAQAFTHDLVVALLGSFYPGVQWSYDGDGSSLGPVKDNDGSLVSRGLEWHSDLVAPTYEDLVKAAQTFVAPAPPRTLQQRVTAAVGEALLIANPDLTVEQQAQITESTIAAFNGGTH